jgi:hypothetical protein
VALLGRFALAAFAMVLTAVGMEGVLAFSPPGGRHLHRSNRRVSAAIDCYPSNPRSYFDLDLRSPETRARFDVARVRGLDDCSATAPFAVEFRYNRLQFRDVDPPARREGVRRVAMLGDSFTEGQGVKERDTYGRVLEAQLNAVEPGHWEVLNFGRRGADFPALRENFEQLLAHGPNITVYGMMLNDAVQSEPLRIRHALLQEGASPPQGASSPLLLRFVRQRIETLRATRETKRWYNDLYSEPNAKGWTRTGRHLVDMDQQMKRRGGRLVVALWPVMADLEGAYPFEHAHSVVGDFCRRAGIEFHDLLADFRGRRTSSLRVHPVDAHPNDVAHRIAATSLAPVVLDTAWRLSDERGRRSLPRARRVAYRHTRATGPTSTRVATP